MGYHVAMRLHISIDDDLIRELDRRIGARQRSAFIERALRRELADISRLEAIDAAIGSIGGHRHEWDDDPADWVRAQRSDPRRTG